ncbi:carboxymuconolactone decarboxylase [Novosphingobium endophyticum]|uniref:Carboxymuconolactone decarboxylase n=1 Tax=Novosphingobium endophyticum TaxID=1955250 RepID=A0A916X6Q6_9SPHN|nr:carboxymuconolactone decarboxylase family protein [Novosphingobium endophyticum]GGC07985.1 carboxymuconolactone decarboxylase [Novosphingobium endophyticum]
MSWDAAARTARVLGEGERLPRLGEDALDERHMAALERLRVIYGYPKGEPLASFFATLANSPEFFAGYISLGVAATEQSALSRRIRELAVLRAGWLYGAPYMWGEHVHATRAALFTSEEIDRITVGSQAQGWDELERAVLRAVEELHGDAMISDATWDELSEHLDSRQLLELPILVGHYATTAFLQNSLRTRLNDHNPGLTAR